MPTFLSDPPLTTLVLLGLVALVFLGIWTRNRKLWPVLVGGVAAVLFVVLLLLGLLYESPREQAIRSITEMAESIGKKDWATFSSHISENFNANGMDKQGMEQGFRQLSETFQLRATAWNFALTEPVIYTDTEIVIRFDAKGEAQGQGQALKHFTAKFVKEGDQFRMVNFVAYNFMNNTAVEPLPGMP